MKSFELFATSPSIMAENPLWNKIDGKLYWKGTKPGEIFRKNIGNNRKEPESLQLPLGMVGGFTFSADGELLIFAQSGRVWQWHDSRKLVQVAELPNADDQTYFNDLIADPEGRIYCGVLGHDYFNPSTRGKYGALWRLNPDGSFHCLDAKTGFYPNGMGFSPDLKYFYFAVTDEQTIYRYEYDRQTGSLDNHQALIRASGCDGMTVDAAGYLWVAIAHQGGPLERYSPDGKRLQVYSFPAEIRDVSSVTFGGADLKKIFVTTANLSRNGPMPNFFDGGVFRLRQSVSGKPEFLI